MPLGVPVQLLITSSDVIHQFWVPEIRLKAAAVPGLVTTFNFTPLQAGTYEVVCSEYCGVDHSLMTGKLVIEPVASFTKWLDAEKTAAAAGGGELDLAAGNAAAGKALFAQKCSACHSLGRRSIRRSSGPGCNAYHRRSRPIRTLVDGKPPTPDNIAGILENGYHRSDRRDAEPSSQRALRQRHRQPRRLPRQPEIAGSRAT